MKSAIIVVSAILLVAALAEGATIQLREKRHSQQAVDPGFAAGRKDPILPPGLYGLNAETSSQAKSGAQSSGLFGGASSSSGAESSARGSGGLTNSKSESKAESFGGANGSFSSSSSSSSSSSGGLPPHFHI